MWLKNNLQTNLSKENLLKFSFDKITYWKKPNGWKNESKTKFINQNYKIIKAKITELTKTNCDYHVFSESLNPFIYEGKEFSEYFDNCNQAKEWMYPVKNIVISNKDVKQDHLEFLKTENGYKLISVSLAKENLK